jgi:hypothetical protein
MARMVEVTCPRANVNASMGSCLRYALAAADKIQPQLLADIATVTAPYLHQFI